MQHYKRFVLYNLICLLALDMNFHVLRELLGDVGYKGALFLQSHFVVAGGRPFLVGEGTLLGVGIGSLLVFLDLDLNLRLLACRFGVTLGVTFGVT